MAYGLEIEDRRPTPLLYRFPTLNQFTFALEEAEVYQVRKLAWLYFFITSKLGVGELRVKKELINIKRVEVSFSF